MEQDIQAPTPSPKNKFAVILLALILIPSLLLNLYLFKINKSAPQTSKNLSQTQNTSQELAIGKWEKLSSNSQGYPIAKNDTAENTRNLFIYSLTKNKLEDLGVQVDSGGGGAGFGESDPLPSPNLYYTAFIDKKTSNLWLVSNETLEKKQITKEGHVGYISGWSPDSKKFIYSTQEIDFQGPGSPQNQNYNPNLLPGFHLFNIESGQDTYLYPVSYFEGFIDNNNIMVRSNNQDEVPYIFNINGFKTDRDTIKDSFGFESGQFNFSPDGKKWAFIFSNNPTDDNSIVYTDFPNKKGITVDSGGWTDTQWPLISPNQDKIAYQRREGDIRPGDPKFTVWVYEIDSKNKKKYLDGSPVAWAGDNKLIVRDSNGAPSLNESVFYLFDLNSGQKTQIN